MKPLSMLIVAIGLVGSWWMARALFPGQWLPAFGVGLAGTLLSLLISVRLPKPPEPPGPYVPVQHRVLATVGHYYGGAAAAVGVALLIAWLLLQAGGMRPDYLAWGYACAGNMVGLAAYVALSARKWADASKAEARNAYWPGN